MEVKPGYKDTEVGVIPEEWQVKRIVDCCVYADYRGKTPPKSLSGVFLVTARNIRKGYIDYQESQEYVPEELYAKIMQRGRPRIGDVLITTEAPLGNVAQIDREDIALAQRIIRYRPKSTHLLANYLKQFLLSERFQQILSEHASGSTAKGIKGSVLHRLHIAIPPQPEQQAIAKLLRDCEALLGSLDGLIAKKRDLKQAVTQQLLTGETRLPGFYGEWKTKHIAEIATPTTEKNSSGCRLPVLTCSKHLGFMDSLEFFKNQVFSKDLSTYKIIRRGEIGYPANHVEEGSIGLQNLYDVALVSPIYIVFAVNEDINSFFLHRVLKLNSYRQKFKIATTSSVDRRGSLRWPAFSEITVRLPLLPEQNAIAEVLVDMDEELSALELRLEKTRYIKQAMMQELLTGRIRLVISKVDE